METVTIRISRTPLEEGGKPQEEFHVPLRPAMSVLDGLYYILEKIDGSIAFRSSCRAGVCGSCAMLINGRTRLACETQIQALKSSIVRLEPLGHLPVLKDLVVDMKPFWDHYKKIRPYLIPGDPEPERERIQTVDERERLNKLIDCILCGACYASCNVTGTDPEYLGPAALTKTNRFLQDSRDRAKEERLNLTGGEHGVWRCHTIFNCQEVCPKDIDPSGSIAAIKRISLIKGVCGR